MREVIINIYSDIMYPNMKGGEVRTETFHKYIYESVSNPKPTDLHYNTVLAAISEHLEFIINHYINKLVTIITAGKQL